VEACRYGEAEVIIGLPARVASWIHGLWPGTTADALATIDRFLPGPARRGTRARRGAESRSRLTPAVLTALTDRAAVEGGQEELRTAR
jgi:hypothetical protein